MADIGRGILDDERQVGGLGEGVEVVEQHLLRQSRERWRNGHERVITGSFGFLGPRDGLRSTLRADAGKDGAATVDDFRDEMRQARALAGGESEDFTDHTRAAAIGASVERPVELPAQAGFVDGVAIRKRRVHDGQHAGELSRIGHHQSPTLPSR